MIPAFVIFLLSMLVYIIAKIPTGGGTFIEDGLIHSGASARSDRLSVGIAFFISFPWWFGVHGQSIVNGVVTALLLSSR